MYAGDTQMVTWEAREICGRYTADLEVSLDNGRTFVSKGEFKNATSATWKVPNADGAQVIVRVSLHDQLGEVSDSADDLLGVPADANRLLAARAADEIGHRRDGMGRPPVGLHCARRFVVSRVVSDLSGHGFTRSRRPARECRTKGGRSASASCLAGCQTAA